MPKKISIFEFFVENSIKAIALLSLAFILGIFYFVFQESYWAFKPEKNKLKYQNIQKPLKHTDEIYSNGEIYFDDELRPEKYPPDTNRSNLLLNRSDSVKINIINPIDEGKKISLHRYSSGNEKAISFWDLIKANDIIEGEPAYIWQPISVEPKYNILSLIFGSFKVSLIGIIIAFPISVLAALFTIAFAPKWLREIIKPVVEILAGLPTVVIGFFCLTVLSGYFEELFNTQLRLNAFLGGIGLSIVIVPIVYTLVEDALYIVPKHLSEASLALGANRWQTAYKVLLPAALPGVFAALLMGFGRAFGETMIALMITGNAAVITANIFDSVRTMAATIGSEMAEVEYRSIHYGVLFIIGSVLFIITFSINAIAEFIFRKKLLNKYRGY
ncbi:MAG: phosphate ABC transporter permease subunit PstC [Candidatus Kapabacteria bacterium]|nr:phosphate ABC transporter permease subunit PstC [Candidatus Kapabacteria bacterium]